MYSLFFINHPFVTFAFTLMILAMVSMWVIRRFYVWGPLLAGSFICALIANMVDPIALIPIAVLLVCHWGISRNVSGWLRFCISTVAAVVSFALNWHLVKGFYNPMVAGPLQISADAVPFKWYLNFDKPFTGLFALGLYLPLIRSNLRFLKVLLPTIAWTALSIFVLLGFSLYANIIAWDIKWFGFFPIFLFFNFFLVVIPEETFYRGFLQREITLQLKNRASGILAITVVSLLFASSHLLFVPSFNFFIASFLASACYGGIFLLTGSIESSIITHFCINTLHLILFTYPALKLT